MTYTATDKARNEASIPRMVTVVAPLLKSLSLESNVSNLNVGESAELTVMGTYSDGSTKDINIDIEYIIYPSDSAEMNGTLLIVKKDENITVQVKVDSILSNILNLNIAWVVEGHTLPPEPDPIINNATLGGIDSNNNGVRDDVERNIYEKYPIPIERVILLERGKFYQRTMIEPVTNAKEIVKFSIKIGNCFMYFQFIGHRASEWRENREYIKSISFNSEHRIQKYLDYNIALSGGSYGSSPKDWNREACSGEVIEVLEGMGL